MFPGCSEMNVFGCYTCIYRMTEMIAHRMFWLVHIAEEGSEPKHSMCSCFCHATYNAVKNSFSHIYYYSDTLPVHVPLQLIVFLPTMCVCVHCVYVWVCVRRGRISIVWL